MDPESGIETSSTDKHPAMKTEQEPKYNRTRNSRKEANNELVKSW